MNGVHGTEGAWVGFKIDGQYVGCPDRAPSFASNTWEFRAASTNAGYTYYLPVTKDMIGKQIEVVTLALGRNNQYVNVERPDTGSRDGSQQASGLRPEVWLTTSPL